MYICPSHAILRMRARMASGGARGMLRTLRIPSYNDAHEHLKSRVDEFSRVETKVYMSPVGIDIAIAWEGPASDIDRVFLARQVALREFGYVLSADHVRFIPTTV